ncbi:phage tail tape measure protein [Microvirga sp. Mcv34]|uniref:phage tail tape measure protein n=1 Tax=Microvirga sp. Mcv34 TaxID=2926016 RepID=UPI0021C734F5|nr:phage tail tape measure protein [Microvirga sp. Mcv34]
MLVGASGRAMAQIGGVVGAAALMRKSFVEFATFDRRMTRIGITADASAEEIKKISSELHGLAQETATPIDGVVSGLEALVSAGRSLPDAMAFLPAVVRTAAASGSEVSDIAKTAEAVGTNFKISGQEMQTAFDIMAKGGKEGQFELNDMARYLPSLAAAAGAVGIKGTQGLAQFVSMLQVVRKGTGTAEEAAASMNNIFTKMESEETTKKFSKFGIDLRKEMAKARKDGKNLIETFEDLAWKATKGDLSKLPQLIGDMEFSRGVRALLTYRGEWQKMAKDVGNAAGTVAEDAKRVTADAQSSVDRLGNSWTRSLQGMGRFLDSIGTSTALDNIGRGAERAADGFDKLADSVNRGTVVEDWLSGMERMEKVIQETERLRKEKEAADKAAADSAEMGRLQEQRASAEAISQSTFGDNRLTAGTDAQIRSRQAVAAAERARNDPDFALDLEVERRRRLLSADVENARGNLGGSWLPWGKSGDEAAADLSRAEAALAEFDQLAEAVRGARAALQGLGQQAGEISGLGINRAATAYRPDQLAPVLNGLNSFRLSRSGIPPGAEDRFATPVAHPEPPVRPSVDTSQLDATKTKAVEAETAIGALNMTVAPNVEAGAISSAIEQARTLKAILDSIGPAARSAGDAVKGAKDAASVPGKQSSVRTVDKAIQQARRNGYADTFQVT